MLGAEGLRRELIEWISSPPS